MADHPFFRLNRDGIRWEENPERFYVRFDQLELLGAGGRSEQSAALFFEAVEADWFDAHSRERLGDEAFYADIRLAVLRLRVTAGTDPFGFATGAFARQELGFDTPDVDDWFELELDSRRPLPASRVTLYRHLHSPGQPRRLVTLRRASPKAKNRLRKEAMPDEQDFPTATQSEIKGALKALAKTAVDHVVAYDVGQGAAVGLCDAAGAVLSYCDLGGGVLGNTHTYPSGLKEFCFHHAPPIILTHWDWDHWSSADVDVRAESRTWVAPRQKVGSVHTTFMHRIKSAGGSLLFWPASLPSVIVGPLQIERCTGSNRNNSGLALILHEKASATGQQMLFPGDARYDFIPSYMNTFTSVLVPHHGGDMGWRWAPTSPALGQSRAVYTFGRRNTFAHPRRVTRQDHDSAGWADADLHGGHGPDDVRKTTLRLKAGGLGHVQLTWTASRPLLAKACQTTPCGAHPICQLDPRQT